MFDAADETAKPSANLEKSLPVDSDALPDEPLNVLLIEDITSDALLIRLAINASRIPCQLHMLPKGDEVLPWFRQALAQECPVLPDVILLDLGLPKMDGFQLLEELAKSPSLRAIPIVILTGYGDFDYIRKSYNLPIAAYLTKPCTVDKIRDVLIRIQRGKTAAGAP